MYLFRQSNSVYYTRIATPFSLRDHGFPREIRLSLFTRERRLAYRRNIEQTKTIFALFDEAKARSLSFQSFKQKLNGEINQLRESFNHQAIDPLSKCRPIGTLIFGETIILRCYSDCFLNKKQQPLDFLKFSVRCY